MKKVKEQKFKFNILHLPHCYSIMLSESYEPSDLSRDLLFMCEFSCTLHSTNFQHFLMISCIFPALQAVLTPNTNDKVVGVKRIRMLLILG